MNSEPLFTPQHFYMVLTVLTPFLLFWWDTRRQNEKHHQETQKANAKMHEENKIRLTAIETQLRPIVDWWNRQIGRIAGTGD